MDRTISENDVREARTSKKRFIEIRSLKAYPELVQGFTTRFGGVSTGPFESLNLSFNRPDAKENVMENYRLLSASLGVPMSDMVLSHQVHLSKVKPVTREHAGMGLIRERNFKDVDGLVTREPGLMLVTHYADCVPLYFYDPVKKAIGLAHSGWKSTLQNIGIETVKVLHQAFGCDPSDLKVAIGPHIRACCFEVGQDVSAQFHEVFPWAMQYSQQRSDGKWLLDLEGIITEALVSCGVQRKNIAGGGPCTKCHDDVFFSHRGSGGNSGICAAFIMIRG